MIVQLIGGLMAPVDILFADTLISAEKIKVAYIYQFSQFVTWPDTVTSANQAFSVCEIGSDPIVSELEPLTRRQVDGQKITLRYITEIRDTNNCNILYVGDLKGRQLNELFRYLHGKPVLTVSSIPNFVRKGGMIDFVIQNKKVRLETNVETVRHAKLKISAKLLEVCLRVFGTKKDTE